MRNLKQIDGLIVNISPFEFQDMIISDINYIYIHTHVYVYYLFITYVFTNPVIRFIFLWRILITNLSSFLRSYIYYPYFQGVLNTFLSIQRRISNGSINA